MKNIDKIYSEEVKSIWRVSLMILVFTGFMFIIMNKFFIEYFEIMNTLFGVSFYFFILISVLLAALRLARKKYSV